MNYAEVCQDGEWFYMWSNCYGDIFGDADYDGQYEPTHWKPIDLTPPTK